MLMDYFIFFYYLMNVSWKEEENERKKNIYMNQCCIED